MSSFEQPAGRRSWKQNTFRRSERITGNADFSDLIKNGTKYSTQDILFYSRKTDLSHSRFGVAAPKRLGSAPLRNRCKRRLRELFRTNKGAVPKGFDILAVITKDISYKKFNDVADAFMQAVGRL